MNITELAVGQRGRIVCVRGEASDRLRELGFREGGEIRCLFRAPFGDPTAYLVEDIAVALRYCDGREIQVEML